VLTEFAEHVGYFLKLNCLPLLVSTSRKAISIDEIQRREEQPQEMGDLEVSAMLLPDHGPVF